MTTPTTRATHLLRTMAVAALAGSLLLCVACGERTTNGTSSTSAQPQPATSAATPLTSSSVTTSATTVATSSPSSTTTTLDATATKAAITANWEKFFLPTTSIPDRLALLENGASLQQALEQRATDPLQQQASAKVKNVDLTAPDHATVTYDVLLNGTVALADSQGIAVLQEGVWKVSANSFCALISLGATTPIPGCS